MWWGERGIDIIAESAWAIRCQCSSSLFPTDFGKSSCELLTNLSYDSIFKISNLIFFPTV